MGGHASGTKIGHPNLVAIMSATSLLMRRIVMGITLLTIFCPLRSLVVAGQDDAPDFLMLIRELNNPGRPLEAQLDLADQFFCETRDQTDERLQPWFAALIQEMSRLAEQGDAKWQVRLGNEYLGGYRVPRNEEKALACYIRAARNDYPGAYVSIGDYYGNRNRHSEALRFWRIAAMLGSADACCMISMMYGPHAKLGTSWKDEYAWCLLAQRRGIPLRVTPMSGKLIGPDPDGQARAQEIELELDNMRFQRNWQQYLNDVKAIEMNCGAPK